MAYSAILPFAAKTAGTVTRLNQGVENTNALVDGSKAFNRLSLTHNDVTTTGTVDNFDPGATVVQRCNNASALVIRGIVPAFDGQIAIFEAINSTVQVLHQHASATAANRAITPSTAGQIINTGGSMAFRYDGTTDRWRLLWVDPGAPIDIAYAAGNFTTSGGGATWTLPLGAPNQVSAAYRQRGNEVVLGVMVTNSTIATATAAHLRYALPNSFAIGSREVVPCMVDIRSNGAQTTGIVHAVAAQTHVRIFKSDRVSWAIGAANNDVAFMVPLWVA